jgi:hypothetical protein
MINETTDFPMPELISIGPERMLERLKARGLVVPLSGYIIHALGVSPDHLMPEDWNTIRRFWEDYFAASGARLDMYSIASDPHR